MTTSDTSPPARNPAAERRVAWRLRYYGLPFLLCAALLATPYIPVYLFIVAALLALPWIFLGLLLAYSGLTRAPGSRLIADFGIMLGLSALVFFYRAFVDMRTVEMHDTLFPALVPAAALLAAALAGFRSAGASWRGAALAAAVAAPLYGYGAALYANALLDRTPAQPYETRVVERRIAFSPLVGGAQVLLRAWGPLAEDRWEGHLPRGMWDFAGPGSRVCLGIHAGAFSIPWYDIRSCRKERKECVRDPDCQAWLNEMLERLSKDPAAVPRRG